MEPSGALRATRWLHPGYKFVKLLNHNSGLGPEPPQQMQHRRFRHRDASGGRSEIVARQMQEHRAAAAGDARMGVVIDLDDKIIEMIVALQPIAAAVGIELHRLVVMAAGGGLAPGVPGADGAHPPGCARAWG